ncbi:hypothetical protein FQN60_009167 [Etheostoma spectabile]|uniref:Uncharacterized protein n=1 Tax=Etheostoma spectabile TaxID=54343 RepID=A0A5J5CBJ1_9PERO|nr:hypothetical protein FQN60_009167 [Etheostoma spectabile]
MILSWVMVQSDTEKSLKTMYEGLAHRYSTASIEKAHYQCLDRDCCAAFKVAESYTGEQMNWDAWKTTLLLLMPLLPFQWWIRKTCKGLKRHMSSVEFSLPTQQRHTFVSTAGTEFHSLKSLSRELREFSSTFTSQLIQMVLLSSSLQC